MVVESKLKRNKRYRPGASGTDQGPVLGVQIAGGTEVKQNAFGIIILQFEEEKLIKARGR